MSESKNFLLKNFFDTYRGLPCIYTAGELALASSPLFRKHRLRLYRQQPFFIDRSGHRYIVESYLIVKDRTPVMRLQIDFDHNQSFLDSSKPGQPPVYLIYAPDMEKGQVDKVLSCLEQRLQEPAVPNWSDCTYIQLSSAAHIHHTLVELHMIRKTAAHVRDHIWLPTDYGASLGLIDGYMIRDDGQLCHTLFIPAARRMELYRALIWPRTCRDEPQAVMTLEQRLEKVRQGLPCSNANAIEPVRAFGAIPMADYMASYPEYTELGKMATFQEAADRIFQFCMAYNTPEDCMDYIACLILPLISIYNGTAPVNQATKPAQNLLRLPFPSLLMGAATAAGQPGLLRNTQLILDDVLEGKADKLPTSCSTLLCNLPTGIDGVVLLFRLFVEPFALLNRSAAVYPQERSEPIHSM